MAVNLFQSGGVDNNWSTIGNWSQGTVPTATDGHVTTFDATSPDCTVNTTNRVCNNIDFTGYTNTITMSFSITVSGNIVLGASMLVAGSALLGQAATGNLTSAGFIWPNALTLSGTAMTHTLIDNWEVNGNVIFTGFTSKVINGAFTLRCNANLSLTTSATTTSGTATIRLGGTGDWTHTGSAALRNNLTIDTSGTITFGSVIGYNTGTFTYISGTVDATGSTFTSTLSTTFNVNSGIVFNNFTFSGSGQTCTLGGDLWIGGVLNTSAATSTIFSGAYTIYVGGNLTIANNGSWNAAGGFLGIIWNGSGSTAVWSGQGNITVNLTINGSGTLTLSGEVSYRTGTFTYISGTVVTTSSTLEIWTGTYNTAGIIWNNVITNQASSTSTLTSVMTITGILTLGVTTGTSTLNGSSISLSGNLVINSTTGNVTGTTVLNIIGDCTWTMPLYTTGTMRMLMNINNSGFTLTISGNVSYSTQTITYTAGTVAGSGTLFMAGTLTVNSAGLTIINLGCSSNSTFNGTHGFTIANWTCLTTGLTHTFQSTNTYYITTSLTLGSTSASPKSIVSSSGGSQAIIILQQGASQDIYYTAITDINSSGGQTIWNFKGTLTNATNWRALTANQTRSFSG